MAILKPINDGRLLKERAYEALREALIRLELRPGEPLTERSLSERLGVSKSPIRDALIQLEQEGLVRSTPFKGFEVAWVTEEHLLNTFQFRDAIEPYCVGHFARHWTDATLADLLRTHEDQARLIRTREPIRAFEQSRFHPILLKSLNNPMFRFASRVIQAHIRRLQYLVSADLDRVVKTHAEHSTILEAIRARDAAQAQDRMRFHLQSVLEDILASEKLRRMTGGKFDGK